MSRYLLTLLSLAAVLAAPAAQAQTILQPGDALSISVLEDSSLNRSVLIDPSGEIAFPLAGHIQAKGLTPQALEQIIGDKLKESYKDRPNVTVALTSAAAKEEELKPIVYVTGEVAKPGAYAYVAGRPITLMQVIAMAGGLGPYAAKTRIQVRRGSESGGKEDIFTFDYKAYEAGKNTDANIPLKNGDMVVIPERRLFE
jgi:polysaccharide export outer membrane protein